MKYFLYGNLLLFTIAQSFLKYLEFENFQGVMFSNF